MPVITCSGYNEKLDKGKATLFKINFFMDKPILLKDLTTKIRQILDEKRAIK